VFCLFGTGIRSSEGAPNIALPGDANFQTPQLPDHLKDGSALRYFVRFYWLKGENFAGVLKKDM